MQEIVFEKSIAKINVKADIKYLRPVLESVRLFAECEGLAPKTASLLEVAVEEACANVIKHAYAPDENGYFDVSISRRPHQIVVSIEDRGIPLDIATLEKNNNNSLGVMMIKSIADEVVFQNLGENGKRENGKRVKIIKNLPSESETALEDRSGENRNEQTQCCQAPEPIEIRFMAPEEAIKLSQCIYQVYGYTYISTLYYPEKIAEMIKSNILKSVVAVNAANGIVAHLGLKLPHPGAKIFESAQAAVMPQYRGMHLFEKMKKFSASYAEKNGIYGLYSESVTLHPYTQKGNIALGAKETGLALAFIPETAFFKKIQKDGEKSQRQAAMFFYMKTCDGPEHKVYAPLRHRELIEKIYEHNALKRTFENPAAAILTGRSTLDINFNPYLNIAVILVNSIGNDFEAAIKNYKRDLCEKRADCIYVFISLSNEAAPGASGILESLKFSFAGIIPEYFLGDCAIYQYLNNVPVDAEKICAVSDFAKMLKEYIIKEYDGSKNL